MLTLLIAIGRICIQVGALLTILGGAAVGGMFGYYFQTHTIYGLSSHPNVLPEAGAIVGALLALLTAGVWLSLVACVFDMQKSLRVLRNQAEEPPPPRAGIRQRREPTLVGNGESAADATPAG